MTVFLKLLLTVLSDASNQEDHNNCISSEINVLGKPLFALTALIRFWMKFPQYFAFSDLTTSRFIGYISYKVFDRRNVWYKAFKSSIGECLGNLSTVERTLQFSISNFLSVWLDKSRKSFQRFYSIKTTHFYWFSNYSVALTVCRVSTTSLYQILLWRYCVELSMYATIIWRLKFILIARHHRENFLIDLSIYWNLLRFFYK